MLDVVQHVRSLFGLMSPVLDERTERLLAAAVATSLGRGGTAAVTKATGIRSKRIAAGKRDLRELAESPEDSPLVTRIRRAGGGRKPIEDVDPELVTALESLIEPTTRGDPESPLRWTTKSLRHLSEELTAKGHRVGRTVVGELLHSLGYSLQANSKRIEGKQHPDRDAQFRHINRRTKAMQRAGEPVISVDTKKKELIGAFANKGREWRPRGEPVAVQVHDFPDPKVGKAVPYGIYDVARDEGFVNVGTSADTGEFAVASIRDWWKMMGRKAYPNAKRLYIVADSGGSNGSRNSLWKVELQRFANRTGLELEVSHMPPGTSKWNRIEHRLFSAISMNWRGKPLESYEAVVNLIGATTTRSGLRVRAKLDEKTYERGIKVPREVTRSLTIRKHAFHGDWNYRFKPSV